MKLFNSLKIKEIVLEGFSKMERSIYPSMHTYKGMGFWNFFISYVILRLTYLKCLFCIWLNPTPPFATWLRNHLGS